MADALIQVMERPADRTIRTRGRPRSSNSSLRRAASLQQIRDALSRILRCFGDPLEDGWVQRLFEFNSTKVTRNPADGAFERLDAIELHPNALTDGRPLDKFDFASFG